MKNKSSKIFNDIVIKIQVSDAVLIAVPEIDYGPLYEKKYSWKNTTIRKGSFIKLVRMRAFLTVSNQLELMQH